MTVLTTIVKNTGYKYHEVLQMSPDFINMVYESLTRVVISDYKWLAVMNRIENKELENFGNNLFIEKQGEIKESKPKQFDIRELEAQAIANPHVAYYFRGKRLPNKLKKRV